MDTPINLAKGRGSSCMGLLGGIMRAYAASSAWAWYKINDLQGNGGFAVQTEAWADDRNRRCPDRNPVLDVRRNGGGGHALRGRQHRPSHDRGVPLWDRSRSTASARAALAQRISAR